MRDPKRIDKILERIGALWKKYPDLRLMQLIGNCYTEITDLYNVEDDSLVYRLEYTYCEKKPSSPNGMASGFEPDITAGSNPAEGTTEYPACETCKYWGVPDDQEPCKTCCTVLGKRAPAWEPDSSGGANTYLSDAEMMGLIEEAGYIIPLSEIREWDEDDRIAIATYVAREIINRDGGKQLELPATPDALKRVQSVTGDKKLP